MKESLGPTTIVYPTPVFVIGTYDAQGSPNAMTAAWGGICCSEPPSVAVGVRSQRHTFVSLAERKAFTVSIPSEAYVAQADFLGMVSGRRENKWERTGLTPVRSGLVDAPYVEEFPLVLECTVSHAVDLGTHTLFVGRVLDVKVDADCLNSGHVPDVRKVKPCLFAPGEENYYSFGDILGRAFSIGAVYKRTPGGSRQKPGDGESCFPKTAPERVNSERNSRPKLRNLTLRRTRRSSGV